MKTLFKCIIIIITLTIVSCIAIVTFDSRDYFKDYFKIKQEKMLLATEAETDSLVNVIEMYSIQNDSLQYVINKYAEILDIKETQIKTFYVTKQDLIKSNTNLTNVISHQNNMINNLKFQIKLANK